MQCKVRHEGIHAPLAQERIVLVFFWLSFSAFVELGEVVKIQVNIDEAMSPGRVAKWPQIR